MKTSSPELAILIALITESSGNALSEPSLPGIEAMDASELIEYYFAIKERLSEIGIRPTSRIFPPEKLYISCDYRIRIGGHEGKELMLSPLVKTVFIFFLRHPEGIHSFEGEMFRIYSRITGRTNLSSIRRSIERLTDVSDNSIHEKCSRLKESLSEYFSEKTLDNYVVKGRYGRGRGISIDREYVIWE